MGINARDSVNELPDSGVLYARCAELRLHVLELQMALEGSLKRPGFLGSNLRANSASISDAMNISFLSVLDGGKKG